MVAQETDKTFELRTSWKNHIAGYILSILAIPLAGIGLIALYLIYRRQKRYSYTVTDTQIIAENTRYHRTIDLVDIDRVTVAQDWIQDKMGVGDVVLHTSALEVPLYGMENPFHLKKLIEQGIAAEKGRQQEEQKTGPREPEYDPGTMERMDYLTGLWQQGLVSDEDYEKERRHFE